MATRMNREQYLEKVGQLLAELQEVVRGWQGELNRGVGGREAALVQTKLDEARMWHREAQQLLAGE